MGARRDPDAARGSPRSPQRGRFLTQAGQDRDVELRAPGHVDDLPRRPDRRDPACVLAALHRDCRDSVQLGPEQSAEPQVARRGSFRQPNVGHDHRYAAGAAMCQQVRPDLGLHDDCDARFDPVEESLDPSGEVEREVAMDDSAAKRLGDLVGAGRGRRRDDDRLVGMISPDRLDDRQGGLDLADRHRVEPHASAFGRDSGAVSETLVQTLPVGAVAQSAPQKPRNEKRRRQVQCRRIQSPRAHLVPPGTKEASVSGFMRRRCNLKVLRIRK